MFVCDLMFTQVCTQNFGQPNKKPVSFYFCSHFSISSLLPGKDPSSYLRLDHSLGKSCSETVPSKAAEIMQGFHLVPWAERLVQREWLQSQ